MTARRAILACAMLPALLASPTALAAPETVRTHMPYTEARRHLLAAGWTATQAAATCDLPKDACALDAAGRADFVRAGFTEVGSCFPTGLGQCFAVWRRGERLFVVELLSEERAPKHVYFYFQTRLRHRGPIRRADWDWRTAKPIAGSHPPLPRQW